MPGWVGKSDVLSHGSPKFALSSVLPVARAAGQAVRHTPGNRGKTDLRQIFGIARKTLFLLGTRLSVTELRFERTGA